MTTPRAPARPSPPLAGPPPGAETESALTAVEQAIAALGEALASHDVAAIEATAGELQNVMRAAMARFAQAARRGTMPPALRRRFALAAGQVAAQREALFRASTAVDQALDIFLPRQPVERNVYSVGGATQRGSGRVIAAS